MEGQAPQQVTESELHLLLLCAKLCAPLADRIAARGTANRIRRCPECSLAASEREMTDEELGVGYFDSLLYKGMLGGLPSPTTTLQQPPQQASQPPQQQQAQPQDGAPQQGRDRAPPQQSSQAPTPQSQQQQQQQQRPAHASPPETPQTPPISPHCPQTSFRFLTATSAPNAAGAGGGSADMFGMYTAGLSDFGCDHSPHGAGTDFHDGTHLLDKRAACAWECRKLFLSGRVACHRVRLRHTVRVMG
eukprot:scaffold4384_cov367-Prasinococcus_capsulatus_cf.AAC.8